MAQDLFGRNTAVTFGPEGSKGTLVTGLRVSFDIDKNSDSNSNTSRISIYNLNRDNRDKLQRQENFKILLEAGYGLQLGVIFFGDITKVSSEKHGPDWITEIECGDGHKALYDSFVQVLSESGNLDSVVDFALEEFKAFGVGLKEKLPATIQSIRGEIAQNGFSFSGTLKTLMDTLVQTQAGFEWNIQDFNLQVIDVNADIPEVQAISITPETGLIGSPKFREEGIEFDAFIQGRRLNPGEVVKLKTDRVDGIYRVRKARYRGDTHDNDWRMTVTAK